MKVQIPILFSVFLICSSSIQATELSETSWHLSPNLGWTTEKYRRRHQEWLVESKSMNFNNDFLGLDSVEANNRECSEVAWLVLRSAEIKPVESIRLLGAAAKQHPNFIWAIEDALSKNYADLNDIKTAKTLLKQSIDQQEQVIVSSPARACRSRMAAKMLPQSYSKLADLCARSGELNRAIAFCRKSTELSPRTFIYLKQLSVLLERAGKTDEAKVAQEQATEAQVIWGDFPK